MESRSSMNHPSQLCKFSRNLRKIPWRLEANDSKLRWSPLKVASTAYWLWRRRAFILSLFGRSRTRGISFSGAFQKWWLLEWVRRSPGHLLRYARYWDRLSLIRSKIVDSCCRKSPSSYSRRMTRHTSSTSLRVSWGINSSRRSSHPFLSRSHLQWVESKCSSRRRTRRDGWKGRFLTFTTWCSSTTTLGDPSTTSTSTSYFLGSWPNTITKKSNWRVQTSIETSRHQ